MRAWGVVVNDNSFTDEEMTDESEPQTLSFAEFLESASEHSSAMVHDIAKYNRGNPVLTPPTIKLYCDSDECDGYTYFDPERGNKYLEIGNSESLFVTYCCRHCCNAYKTYSLIVRVESCDLSVSQGEVTKVGEVPAFGIRIDKKIKKFVGGGHWDLFRKAVSAEENGLGIGAYAYYRRLVDLQKDVLFDELIKACEKINAPAEYIADLNVAKGEQFFTRAVEKIKHAIPDSLLVSGHNPLQILYDALSVGIHDRSDEECLADAHAIRLVLTELSIRLAQITKENQKLEGAVSHLLKRKSPIPKVAEH